MAGCSPDLHPIEHVRDEMERQHQNQPVMLPQLAQSFIDIWSSNPRLFWIVWCLQCNAAAPPISAQMRDILNIQVLYKTLDLNCCTDRPLSTAGHTRLASYPVREIQLYIIQRWLKRYFDSPLFKNIWNGRSLNKRHRGGIMLTNYHRSRISIT